MNFAKFSKTFFYRTSLVAAYSFMEKVTLRSVKSIINADKIQALSKKQYYKGENKLVRACFPII